MGPPCDGDRDGCGDEDRRREVQEDRGEVEVNGDGNGSGLSEQARTLTASDTAPGSHPASNHTPPSTSDTSPTPTPTPTPTQDPLAPSAESHKRPAFTLGLATAPVAGVLLLLASTCIPGLVVRKGIVGEGHVRPYDVMTLFLSFVSWIRLCVREEWRSAHSLIL